MVSMVVEFGNEYTLYSGVINDSVFWTILFYFCPTENCYYMILQTLYDARILEFVWRQLGDVKCFDKDHFAFYKKI